MCVTQCILCHRFLPPCPTSPILTPTFSHSSWGWGGIGGGWVCGGCVGGWGLLHGKAKGKEVNPSLYSSCEPGFLFLSFLCIGACDDSLLYKDTRPGRCARCICICIFVCSCAMRSHSRKEVQSVIRWSCTLIPNSEVFVTWKTAMLSDLSVMWREYQ